MAALSGFYSCDVVAFCFFGLFVVVNDQAGADMADVVTVYSDGISHGDGQHGDVDRSWTHSCDAVVEREGEGQIEEEAEWWDDDADASSVGGGFSEGEPDDGAADEDDDGGCDAEDWMHPAAAHTVFHGAT